MTPVVFVVISLGCLLISDLYIVQAECPAGESLKIPNGVLTLAVSGDTSPGSIAIVNCDVGYQLHGENYAVCSMNRWSDHGSCGPFKTDCGLPVFPSHANVTVTNTTFSSVAIVHCDIGYKVNGSTDYMVCEHYGMWSPEIWCQLIGNSDCGWPNMPPHANMSVTSTTVNSVAIVRCDIGYKGNGSTDLRVCESDGVWRPLIWCHMIDCGPPVSSSVANVAFLYTTYHSVAKVSCPSGYVLDGDTDRMVCEYDGLWTPNITCILPGCGAPVFPTHATVSFTNTTVNSIAIVRCDPGYKGNGSTDLMICESDFMWRPTIWCQIIDSSKDSSHASSPTSAIAGSVIGVFVILIVVGVGSVVFYRRRKACHSKAANFRAEMINGSDAIQNTDINTVCDSVPGMAQRQSMYDVKNSSDEFLSSSMNELQMASDYDGQPNDKKTQRTGVPISPYQTWTWLWTWVSC